MKIQSINVVEAKIKEVICDFKITENQFKPKFDFIVEGIKDLNNEFPYNLPFSF